MRRLRGTSTFHHDGFLGGTGTVRCGGTCLNLRVGETFGRFVLEGQRTVSMFRREVD